MKNKKHILFWVAIVVVVLLIIGVIVYSTTANHPPSTAKDPKLTTANSAWFDEAFSEENATENKEHTLPMVTVA